MIFVSFFSVSDVPKGNGRTHLSCKSVIRHGVTNKFRETLNNSGKLSNTIKIHIFHTPTHDLGQLCIRYFMYVFVHLFLFFYLAF